MYVCEFKCAEERQIAQITMGILFNISYMDIKPHIIELHGIIAHELNVQASQVRNGQLELML